MDEWLRRVKWGPGEDRLKTSADNWAKPFKWDRAAAVAGKIATVFCLSLGDIWDNEVDPAWRRAAFDVMERTPNLLYLLLSKRIGNAVKMCDPFYGNPLLPKNAALGATMINQPEWDRDIRKLKDAAILLQARFTFASVEPMLGAIDARGNLPDWVICGGESGKDARPMHPQWARDIRDQCKAASVPFLFKQWGEFAPTEIDLSEFLHPNDKRYFGEAIACDGGTFCGFPEHGVVRPVVMRQVGKKIAGRLLDGVEHNEFPEVS